MKIHKNQALNTYVWYRTSNSLNSNSIFVAALELEQKNTLNSYLISFARKAEFWACLKFYKNCLSSAWTR